VTRLSPKKTPMRRPLFCRGYFRVICQQPAGEVNCWRADANVHKIVLVKKRARLGVFLPSVQKFFLERPLLIFLLCGAQPRSLISNHSKQKFERGKYESI
jgi:hypothetical protein